MKSPDFDKFEQETGKYAIWKGNITRNFQKWEEGKKIYSRDKERLSFYLDAEEKQEWKEFIDQNLQFKNFSQLIRKVVSSFIHGPDSLLRTQSNTNDHDFYNFIHQIKEELTLIKGNAELILQERNLTFQDSLSKKLDLIIDSCRAIESKINDFNQVNEYDILIVDDNEDTIRLLVEFYKSYDIQCKGVLYASEAIKELERIQPKVLLLDIMLVDKSGIELYDIIRKNPKYDPIKIYIITAIPRDTLKNPLGDRRVEGCLFKPFDFSELETIVTLFDKFSSYNYED
jgi:CheY-like chemotaxis protein